MKQDQMSFKVWLKLQEQGTSTGDVAGFARPCIGMVRRPWPWDVEDMFFHKKKPSTKK
jgi:hypothetical protein